MVIPIIPKKLIVNKEVHKKILLLSSVLGLSDLEISEFFINSSVWVISEFFINFSDLVLSEFFGDSSVSLLSESFTDFPDYLVSKFVLTSPSV